MDDLKNRRFSFDGRRSISFDSNKFTRSDSSHIASELGSSFSSRFMSYEKLSHSMRLYDVAESSSNHGRRNRNGAWAFVAKIFTLKKAGGDSSDKRQPSAGRSSSWRAGPNRRWPVQGW
ncbi:hypothetical protein L1887_08288 [Cichorium endivia]|nr:hypothetical protein L1887_08288 [Cichorium endivia]